MQVSKAKKGYKLVDTGFGKFEEIPEEWEIKGFNEFVFFQEGPGLRTHQFTKSGMKVVNITNLENDYLNLSKTDKHISLE